MRGGDEHILAALTSRVRRWRDTGHAVVACAHGPGSLERLHGLIRHYGVRTERHAEPFALADLDALRASSAELHLFCGAPGQGFVADALGLVLLDETEILGKPPRHRRRRRHVPPEQAL